ncbi:MAG: hypothetical protein LBH46_01375 [Rickettsiales bacterium]|jgi:hypothetical protein|nr:hypothetical protein [Rickettsiales bacterium]
MSFFGDLWDFVTTPFVMTWDLIDDTWDNIWDFKEKAGNLLTGHGYVSDNRVWAREVDFDSYNNRISDEIFEKTKDGDLYNKHDYENYYWDEVTTDFYSGKKNDNVESTDYIEGLIKSNRKISYNLYVDKYNDYNTKKATQNKITVAQNLFEFRKEREQQQRDSRKYFDKNVQNLFSPTLENKSKNLIDQQQREPLSNNKDIMLGQQDMMTKKQKDPLNSDPQNKPQNLFVIA